MRPEQVSFLPFCIIYGKIKNVYYVNKIQLSTWNFSFFYGIVMKMVSNSDMVVDKEMKKMAKILLCNGSPHTNGCTATALDEMIRVFAEEGMETELIQVGSKAVRGCISCRSCSKLGKCVFDDLVNEVAPKFEEADGLVVGSPVYYGSPNGTLLSFLDRLFYSTGFSKHMKVGAAVVSCRRGGNTASFDVLNKYFTISGMPVASSTYWN